MKNKTKGQVYAEAFESIRNITKLYLSNVEDNFLRTRYEINGAKLNSAYWINAHLVWAEHYLIVRAVGNKNMDIPWLEQFGVGTIADKATQELDINMIRKKMDEVHIEAMNILKSLPDEELGKPNHINASFDNEKTKDAVIKHCIRHEPMHAGHISWILKISGVKMV